jgi:hypothetical protein
LKCVGAFKNLAKLCCIRSRFSIEASDRQGLLRDISEVFAKEKMNVVGVQSQSVKGTAWMTFTVEVSDASLLKKVLQTVKIGGWCGQGEAELGAGVCSKGAIFDATMRAEFVGA